MALMRNKIFKLFGPYEKRIDSNKDANGKGTLERYSEAIGNEIDVNLVPLIENLVQNIYDPERLFTRFLDYQEDTRGVLPLSFFRNATDPNAQAQTEWMRRRILRHIDKLHLIRGTKRCYEILIRLFDPSIETILFKEYFQENRYDAERNYDEGYRYDTTICSECPQYSIDLSTQAAGIIVDGTGELLVDGNNESPFLEYTVGMVNGDGTPTDDFIKALKSIVAFNHPIDCHIKYIRYNSTLITF